MAPRRPKTHERSFASHPRSVHWHYEKNGGVEPRDVAKCSHEEWWFKCEKCSHAFDIRLCDVTCGGSWCQYCSNPPKKLCGDQTCQVCHEKSFASHPKSAHWHDEKNGDVKPRDVFKSSRKECWFRCDKCPHAFRAPLSKVTSCQDQWCPYCANKKLCDNPACQVCHEKSFASHPTSVHWHYEKNGDVKPRDVAKCSNHKYWFQCDKCPHAFDIQLNNVTCHDQWCFYCANKKLCDDQACQVCHAKSFATHPRAAHWNHEKNGESTPRTEFMQSNKRRWFTCDICPHEWNPHLFNVARGQWCPVCKDKTEKAVFECLKRAFGDEIVKHLGTRKYVPKDDDGTWAAFPYKFDIVVEHPSGEKTLTEVDGGHHFRDIGHWNSDARENQHRDLVKHIFALDRGCHVVRIDQEWVACQIARGKTDWETRLIEAVRAQKCAFVCADGSNKYINHPCYWYGAATSLVLKKRRRFGVRVKFAFARNRGIFKRYAQRRSRTRDDTRFGLRALKSR